MDVASPRRRFASLVPVNNMETNIAQVRQQVIREIGKDPFADPTSWELCEKRLPPEMLAFLTDRAGAAKFLHELPVVFPPDKIIAETDGQTCWERIGNFYKNQGRLHEALSIYAALYDHLIFAQEKTARRVRKGTPDRDRGRTKGSDCIQEEIVLRWGNFPP
jgi:hypothetical protein